MEREWAPKRTKERDRVMNDVEPTRRTTKRQEYEGGEKIAASGSTASPPGRLVGAEGIPSGAKSKGDWSSREVESYEGSPGGTSSSLQTGGRGGVGA